MITRWRPLLAFFLVSWPSLLKAFAVEAETCQIEENEECVPTLSMLQMKVAKKNETHVVPWSDGFASWNAARDHDLWDKPNACDRSVLQGSAPLTVLFTISQIWDTVREQRTKYNRASDPFEVHVLGAAYPFEGRSDWSLLAARRPADVPSVRVSLILGTPFQSDNVPPLNGQPNSFLGLQSEIIPAAGKWSDRREEVVCKGNGKWGTAALDEGWSKEDLCRDHGNGLDIVCIEKFYQDVREELPKPDLAVMFSPGFPQLRRRSWDPVLIELLNDGIPFMVSDVVTTSTWGNELRLSGHSGKPILPGDEWKIGSASIGEEWQTSMLMQHYGANLVDARRGPFPILHREYGVLAKNAVVQIYQGYGPDRQPTNLPSVEEVNKHKEIINSINWQNISDEGCSLRELKKMFASPTSQAFDDAMKSMYLSQFKEIARSEAKRLSTQQRQMLQEYGLLAGSDSGGEPKRWDLKVWAFLLQTFGCDND